jgi:hypothetical protein
MMTCVIVASFKFEKKLKLKIDFEKMIYGKLRLTDDAANQPPFLRLG